MDGVNITNSGYGALGAYSIVYGSLGTGVTYDFLEEIQVKTGGFEAEYGQAGGGVVNSVVKTGTNAFKFDAAWYEEPTSIEGTRNDLELSPDTANIVESNRRDVSLSVSGPIWKDKIFYFLAYNPIVEEDTYKLTAGQNGASYFLNDTNGDGAIDETDTPVTFALGQTVQGGRVPDTVTRKRSIDNYAGKVAWYATSNHKFEITAFGDPSDGDVGPQNPTAYLRVLADPINNPDPTASATGLDLGGDQFSFKHQGVWSANFFTELMYATKKNTFTEIGPGVSVRSFVDDVTSGSSGGAGFYEDLEDKSEQYSIKFTNVIGPVELKYGYQYENIDWRQPQQYSGPGYTAYLPNYFETGIDPETALPNSDTDNDGTADAWAEFAITGTGGFDDPDSYVLLNSSTGASVNITPDGTYNVTRTAFQPGNAFTNAKEESAFAQATWDVLPNVTLKAGLRWTSQELKGSEQFSLPFALTPILKKTSAGSTTYVPNQYKFDSEIAPRLGVSWDVKSNGKHKLYANYAEYYQRVPSDLAVRQFSNEVGIQEEIFTDAGLTAPDLNGTCAADPDGDGLYTTVFCHTVDNTGTDPGVIIDGTIDPDLDGVNNEATKLPYTEEWLIGYTWEINDFSSVDFRYINRQVGRVLEDVQFTTNEQFQNVRRGTAAGFETDPFPGHGAAETTGYVLSNPGSNLSSNLFGTPTRDYSGLEVIFNRRFHDGWMTYLNYRFAKLDGNYEGSYRNDNGQSDPFITSLFDLPKASGVDSDGDGKVDTYLTSGTLAGQYTNGPLNTDRRHILNAFVSRQFESGLNIGGRMSLRTGQPRFPLLAHPTYRNAGEIPGINPRYFQQVDVDYSTGMAALTPISSTSSRIRSRDPVGVVGDFNGDGTDDEIVEKYSSIRMYSYDVVKRDAFGQDPATVTFDIRASYDWKIKRSVLTLMVDVFNIFNDNAALGFDNNIENSPGSPNVDYLKANLLQAPRNVRVGLKYTY